MKAIILIELDEKHLMLQANDLYGRLQGYDTVLKPLPERKETRYGWQYRGSAEEYRKEGWNACLDEITSINRPDVVEVK